MEKKDRKKFQNAVNEAIQKVAEEYGFAGKIVKSISSDDSIHSKIMSMADFYELMTDGKAQKGVDVLERILKRDLKMDVVSLKSAFTGAALAHKTLISEGQDVIELMVHADEATPIVNFFGMFSLLYKKVYEEEVNSIGALPTKI